MKLLITFLLAVTFSSSLFSQTTYTWTGSVNNNFSTAGNWSPVRQIGHTNDILIFSNGGNVNAVNINQVTIGQLIIRNNTSVSFSPASGNSKTIYISGCDGDDFVIEQGSSLTVTSNDPTLCISLNHNATSSIYGTLSFTGLGLNNITCTDSLSLIFKSGSVLNQSCPGNIFTTTGIKNAAVFQNGSTFKLNDLNASTPFGFPAPDSKVRFEHGSNFDVFVNNSMAVSTAGRTYSNFIVENYVTLNQNENLITPAVFDDITVKSGAHLSIKNSNQGLGTINIKGNINSDGAIDFMNTESFKNLDICFNGTQIQAISGTGNINFSKNLNSIKIKNNLILNRNLSIDCPVFGAGLINTNNYSLIIMGTQFNGSPSMSSNKLNNPSKDNLHNNMPESFSISQNYPNPFNPSTKIDYQLPFAGKVSIKVYDINGRETAQIIDKTQDAGFYTVQFDGNNLSSGVYFYTVKAEGNGQNFNKTMKMILVK